MEFESFDWDDGNWPKCGKHGLAREDIEALFLRTVSILPAPERRKGEERLLAIGKLGNGRSILVVFTFRIRNNAKLLRPISARYLHEKNGCTMKSKSPQLKKIPILKTDEEAEDFVENADLTEYDLSEFKPYRFEFERKEARVNMRLPISLLDAVKAEARERGIPYQRFIREAVERAIAPINKKAS